MRINRLAARAVARLAAAALFLAAALPALAEDADCLKCHGDRGAVPAKAGEKAPPFVDV